MMMNPSSTSRLLDENGHSEEELLRLYEDLDRQDQETSAQMRNLPSQLEGARSRLGDARVGVMALLDKLTSMSETIKGGSLPSQEEYQRMQDELQMRRLQTETAQEARNRLRGVYAQREADLSKIDNLEGRIRAEIAVTKTRVEELRGKIANLPSSGEARRVAQQKAEIVDKQLAHFRGIRDLTLQVCDEKWIKHEARCGQLGSMEQQRALGQLEEQLKTNERVNQENRVKVTKYQAEFEFEHDIKQIESKVAALNEVVKVYSVQHQHAASAY